MTFELFVVAFFLAVAGPVFAQAQPIVIDNSMLIGIATVLSVVFGGIVSIMAQRASMRNSLAPVKEKVDRIEAHVNSEKTRDQGVIAAKDVEIKLQKEIIDELKRVSALLAQTQSTRDMLQAVSRSAVAGVSLPPHVPVAANVLTPHLPGASVPAVALVAPVEEVLKAIKKDTEETAKNTEETAKNTARTEANTKRTDENMQELKDKA